MPNLSFIQNVNNIAAKLDIIVEANSTFDAGVIPVLQEIALLDLDQAVLDLKKGTFLGNRKLDIDLALNKVGIESTNTLSANLAVWNTTATTVYYNKATVTFVDGVIIEVPFLNDDLSPMVLSNHGAIVAELMTHTAFTTKLVNTGIFDDVGGATGNLVRVHDIVGVSSNVERIQLNAVSGAYKVQNPIYFWGQTTSSFQTLAMRASDIIKLGNDIDSIILLATRITEMLALQAKIPEFITNADSLYANIIKLQTLYTHISNINTVALGIANVNAVVGNATNINTVAAQNANINTLIANLIAIQNAATNAAAAAASAQTATDKSNEIKNVSVGTTSTGAAGSLANVIYNPLTGKFSFVIPQGVKGDKGDAFNVNAVGMFAGRNLYDASVQGFSFLALDQSLIYFKLSVTSGDWSAGAPFGKGDTGATGAIGNGILDIQFTSTTHVSGFAAQSGGVDMYTITYTDTTTDAFIVRNGLDGVQIDDAVMALVSTWSSQKISDQLTLKANQATTYTKTEVDTAISAGSFTLAQAQATALCF